MERTYWIAVGAHLRDMGEQQMEGQTGWEKRRVRHH